MASRGGGGPAFWGKPRETRGEAGIRTWPFGVFRLFGGFLVELGGGGGGAASRCPPGLLLLGAHAYS